MSEEDELDVRLEKLENDELHDAIDALRKGLAELSERVDRIDLARRPAAGRC